MILTIKNTVNNNEQSANIGGHESINSLLQDLKSEGLILSDSDIVKTREGRILSKHDSFDSQNLKDGDVLHVESASVHTSETKKQDDFHQGTKNEELPPKPNFQIPEENAPAGFEQLGIFVLDGSPSMFGEIEKGKDKRTALNEAVQGLFKYIKYESGRVNNILFSIVNFSEMASRRMGVTRAKSANEYDNYDPTIIQGRGTLIHEGLSEAERIADEFLSGDGLHRSVVIIVLSDGECHQPNKTRTVANRLKSKEKVTLCTTFFSAPGTSNTEAVSLMKDVASSSLNYKSTYDAQTLRNFFIGSLST